MYEISKQELEQVHLALFTAINTTSVDIDETVRMLDLEDAAFQIVDRILNPRAHANATT